MRELILSSVFGYSLLRNVIFLVIRVAIAELFMESSTIKHLCFNTPSSSGVRSGYCLHVSKP